MDGGERIAASPAEPDPLACLQYAEAVLAADPDPRARAIIETLRKLYAGERVELDRKWRHERRNELFRYVSRDGRVSDTRIVETFSEYQSINWPRDKNSKANPYGEHDPKRAYYEICQLGFGDKELKYNNLRHILRR